MQFFYIIIIINVYANDEIAQGRPSSGVAAQEHQLNTLLTRMTPRRVPRPPIPQNCYLKKRLFFMFNCLAYSMNKDEYKTRPVSLGITRPA